MQPEIRIEMPEKPQDEDARSSHSSATDSSIASDSKCLPNHHHLVGNTTFIAVSDEKPSRCEAEKISKPKKTRKPDLDVDFVGSVDTGENYYDLFKQTRTLFEFKTPMPSKRFQQPREVPRPVVLGAVAVVERFIQRILYEIFSIFRFFLALAITIFTETLKLVVRGLIQPIIVGFITIMGSHLLQPVLVSFFNYILQPYLSFVNNVLAMIGQTLQPWFMMIGHLLTKVAEVLRSIRLVEINIGSATAAQHPAPQQHQPPQHPMHQV